MILRTPLSVAAIVCTGLLFAQETPTKVEKSAPLEMENMAPDMTLIESIPNSGVEILGDVDVSAAPAACKDKADQMRSDCTYHQVLNAIRATMANEAKEDGSAVYPVVITFVVNQFGDMKDIRVEHTGSSELPKKVNVALYGLPKFVPATKGGANVGSTVKITYPYDTLFEKGE